MGRRTTPRGQRGSALRALEGAQSGTDLATRLADKRRRDSLYRAAQLARRELLEEIVGTAECLAVARDTDGQPIVRRDAIWRLLAALERSSYCCSISDAARLLRVSRQSLHQTARSAERTGLVELATNPDDRRILQVLLTRSGRSQLAAARSVETGWLSSLLSGLDRHRLATTVLRRPGAAPSTRPSTPAGCLARLRGPTAARIYMECVRSRGERGQSRP